MAVRLARVAEYHEPAAHGLGALIALSVELAAAALRVRSQLIGRGTQMNEAVGERTPSEEWYEESPFESVSDSQTCNATPRVLQPSNATPQPSNATPQPTPPCALPKKIDTIMCTEKMKGGKAVRAAAAGKSLLEWEYERRLHKNLRRAERKMRELREELRGWETEPCKDGFTRDWDDGKCHPMSRRGRSMKHHRRAPPATTDLGTRHVQSEAAAFGGVPAQAGDHLGSSRSRLQ